MIVQNDFARQWETVEKQVLGAVRRVGSSGWYILGKEVEQFEQTLAASWGVSHAVGVANGMDALEIGLRCLDLRPGEKVLTTPLSAFATTLAILRAGGLPVFVDVDDNGNIDLDQCMEVLTQDRAIRFLLPVHLYGNPLDLSKLERLKKDFDLKVVEDCAQAIGASHEGRGVGTVGQIAATSFYPTKNLGALGDGGAILTDDPATAARARALRNYGQRAPYLHSEPGLNSRLDELHAAILHDAFLPRLEDWTMRRKAIARTYQAGIRHPLIQLIRCDERAGAVWHLFPVMVAEGEREALRDHLEAGEIISAIHYPSIIPEQEALRTLPVYSFTPKPINAARIARCELSLPVHPFLSEEEIRTVIDVCNRWQP
jgi:dTDP-3-amino-3,4,6-trideoxy-alpha-D-glucose transaminase